MHSHLCARVQGKIRNGSPREFCRAKILQENGIRTCLIEELQITPEFWQLVVIDDRIDGDMYTDIPEMSISDQFRERIVIEIRCISTRAKHLPREINRICAVFHSSKKRLLASCRSKQFYQVCHTPKIRRPHLFDRTTSFLNGIALVNEGGCRLQFFKQSELIVIKCILQLIRRRKRRQIL